MRAFTNAVKGQESLGLLILRIGFGVIFLGYGISKLGDIGGVQGMFSHVGIPLSMVFGPFVAVLEVVGGLALIVGAATRIFSLLLAIVMVVAVLTVTAGHGLMGGFDINLALFVGLIGLVILGAGRYSLDAQTFEKDNMAFVQTQRV